MSAPGSAVRGAGRRPDASMDLLNQILREPVDPDYARVAGAADGPDAPVRPPARGRWAAALVLVLAGTLFAVAALQTDRTAPVAATERTELLTRIGDAETQQDALRLQVDDLNHQIDQLRSVALGDDDASRALEAEIDRLGPAVGQAPVTGPGVVIVVDDASGGADDARDQVLDLDLQVLANGLWASGAEAVAINGHRLSSLTAIRGAGDAITVDYRSLTRPYRVEAIGDPRTLQGRLAESAAGAWWNDLSQNRDMTYTTSDADRLVLDSDPGITLRYAQYGEGVQRR
ncbi:Uncharacterized conserved protein YlxW, UPF0749 family [Microlunatus sagamiharensis]|uniref:Uncharacterized conserved protein YlxW, UPF0749 family n=1 Tax=Microlunatus sagamiharensis TaxID=546874 RepID=A0A1H2M2U0_9ACTN|nr:DUF881 domain-containing protein [Microlunatus sagamiharensis]SDU87432.1 Uncharacterized conserved protein YlxW, UPF0749 family [Microlunatus sagamiharensis]